MSRRKTGRACPLVRMSATMVDPFEWVIVTLPRSTWSLRNSAARRMCLVFLKATG